jgi:hypothetical protein
VIVMLLTALGLMALCVTIHAGGVAAALRRLRLVVETPRGFWGETWVFIRITAWIILLHLGEISVWGIVYVWRGAMPDLASGLYFSAVTYTTTGYGDLVLPESWRIVGGVEALTGILMCGWSTGFFFAIVGRLYGSRPTPTGA